MKVGVSAAPVGDLCEGVGGQDVLAQKEVDSFITLEDPESRRNFSGTNLCLRVNQTDSVLVDGNQ